MREGLPSGVIGYLLAVVVMGTAVAVRWLLDPWLGDNLPLITLFPAVAAAVWFGGYRPAVLAALLGFVACDYLFMEPRRGLGFYGVSGFVAVLAYIASCAIIIGFGEALRVSQVRAQGRRRLLQITLASIGDAVITTDTAHRVVYMNAVAESLTGWTQPEAAGQPLDAVFRIVNEQTNQSVENPAERALREGAIAGLANHTILIAKDGTERPIDDSAAPIRDEQGRVAGCVLVFRDVAARRQADRALRQSEERFGRFMQHLPGLAWIKDVQGRYVYVNDAAEKAFRAPRDMLYQKTDDELFPPEVAAQFKENDRRALASGTGVLVVETLQHEDGILHHSIVSKFPIPGPDGKTALVGGVAFDITERKQAEEALREADRRKDEFLAMLAHELRNPLAPVTSALELMKRTNGSPELLEQARSTMEVQIGQMVRLIDDLLDVSRITRNKLELRKDRIELAPVIRQAVAACRPLADEANLQLNVTMPPEPIYVNADAVRLAQVFGNLLTNACKYTEPGGRIWLTVERHGSDVAVTVKDTGVGIPPEMLPKVFDMFTQIDRSLERSQGGLGIGLSLAKRLVEMHEGTVTAHSEGRGRGSEFVVRLPVLSESPKAPQPLQPILESMPTPSRRILVVDDKRDAARLLAMLFEMSGNETRTAHDGVEAVEAAAAFKPDVILLDIGLPKMNGYEACKKIREQPWGKHMILIAVTGWGQEGDRQRSKEAGFNGHLVKPVKHDDIMKLLAELQTPGGSASR